MKGVTVYTEKNILSDRVINMGRLNHKLLDELAMDSRQNEASFDRLYNELKSYFNLWVDNEQINMKVRHKGFDRAEYLSACSLAVWDATKGYDIEKGNFYARAEFFAKRKMKNVTVYNLRQKRFNADCNTVSLDDLTEDDEVNNADYSRTVIENGMVALGATESLIRKFMEDDKDHEIIDILLTKSGQAEKNEAFTVLFGQYGATERKRVQRARERLKKFLTSNGVNINY
jgi:hypothetical protein